MLIKQFLLIIMGISTGLITAGGIFAFIVSIGVIPRLAAKTHTAYRTIWYENSIILGGIIGNVVHLYSLVIPIGQIGLGMYGIFSGIFTGCVAIALAETLNTIPVFTRRIGVRNSIKYMLLGLALGKGLGSLLYFLKRW